MPPAFGVLTQNLALQNSLKYKVVEVDREYLPRTRSEECTKIHSLINFCPNCFYSTKMSFENKQKKRHKVFDTPPIKS